jgi:hypothetical protein
MSRAAVFILRAVAIVAFSLLTRGFALGVDARSLASAPADDDLWYFTFQIENTTGQPVHVRVIENGVTVLNRQLPKSSRELNEPPSSADDPNPMAISRASVPISSGATRLEIEEISLLNVHHTLDITGFTARPDLDFRIVVSPKRLSASQDLVMPDNLTEEEHRLPRDEQLKLRGLQRRGHPVTAFYIYNESGRAVDVRVLLDGREATTAHVAATPASPPSSRSGEPNVPFFRTSARVNPRASTLEIVESSSLHLRRSFDLKSLDTSRGRTFLITIKADDIQVERATPAR